MASEEWADARLETTYENARAVLEAQRETAADIDEKAMRTVRITAILLGVLASAWTIGNLAFHPGLAAASIVFLLAALCSGVLTYSETDLFLGPNRAYIEQLTENNFDDAEWSEDLLRSYAEWIAANRADVSADARLLFRTQLLLIGGIVSLVLAVAF